MTTHPPPSRRAAKPAAPKESGPRGGEPTAPPKPAERKESGPRGGEATAPPEPAEPKESGPRRAAPGARVCSAEADPGGPRRRELTARLVHDVGKYLARTARNLPAGGALDAALLDMLCRDLYGDSRSPRPAARFAELATELAPLLAPTPPVADGCEPAELAPLHLAASPVASGHEPDALAPLTAAALSAIGLALAELDGLELQVRAGVPAAILRAVELARRVEQQLRALATASQRPKRRSAR